MWFQLFSLLINPKVDFKSPEVLIVSTQERGTWGGGGGWGLEEGIEMGLTR